MIMEEEYTELLTSRHSGWSEQFINGDKVH